MLNRIKDFLAKNYIISFYSRYKTNFDHKISEILALNESDIGLDVDDQEEQALPGQTKYFKTGYYKYMLGRYLMTLPDVENSDVLDTGCGLGWGTYLIADRAKSITGIDLDAKSIEFAQKKWSNANIDFRVWDVLNLSALQEKYDVILSFELIEHLAFQDGIKYLQEAFKALNTDGKIYMSSLYPYSDEVARTEEAKNEFHLHIYTQAEIRKILKEIGFKKIKILGKYLIVAQK